MRRDGTGEKLIYSAYSVLLGSAAAVSLPLFMYRHATGRKSMGKMLERFGLLPDHLRAETPGNIIWIHAASVGEIMAAKPLLDAMQTQWPHRRLVVSTMTQTGYETARKELGSVFAVFQVPMDFAWTVTAVVRQVQPSALVLVETELWPNMLRVCNAMGIPVAVINGRISDKSFPRYMKIKPLMTRLLTHLDLLAMESETSADRVIQLGADPETVTVTGNIKYDRDMSPENVALSRARIASAGWLDADPVITAGSTHDREETAVLEAFKIIRTRYPDARLILAPRHVERTPDLERLLTGYQLPYLKWTQLPLDRMVDSPVPVILVDCLGQLLDAYALADIAFVGGSLTETGGHNMLEPAGLGVPVLFGPHTQNFRDAAAQLLTHDGARVVTSSRNLADQIIHLLNQPETRRAMGEKARSTVRRNSGAVQRTMHVLAPIVSQSEPGSTSPDSTVSSGLTETFPAPPIKDPAVALLSAAVEPLYRAGVTARNIIFNIGLRSARRIPCPVISIGNLTVGGTGKTPLTMLAAEIIQSAGVKVTILTRGYGGRRGDTPGRVPPDADFKEWGDEPVLMARSMPAIPVVVCADRFRGASWALDHHDTECFLLDDGFQHRQLHRDLNILVIDARYPLTLERMLPAGRLREGLQGLLRADMVVFSHTDSATPSCQDLQRVTGSVPDHRIFYGDHELSTLTGVDLVHPFAEMDPGAQVGIICGIADPSAFESSVRQMGCSIVHSSVFPDHHPFDAGDWEYAARQTRLLGGSALLTTAKDAVRITDSALRTAIPIGVVNIRFRVRNMTEFRDQLLESAGGIHG